MPYDEDLAYRIRALLATEGGVDEKTMFGGLAFLVLAYAGFKLAPAAHGGILAEAVPGLTASEARRRWALAFQLILLRFGGTETLSAAAVTAMLIVIQSGPITERR